MKIENYRLKFKGERLYILGNGPSLKELDLDLLEGKNVLAMNRIGLLFGKTKWRPKFYLCVTENYNKDGWREDIDKALDSSTHSFVWDELIGNNPELKGYTSIRCFNNAIPFDIANRSCVQDLWSDCPQSGFNKFGSSMLVAFQLASYMGFAEVIIIGADLGFKNNLLQRVLYRLGLPNVIPDPNHFSKGYGTPGLDSATLNRNMVLAHVLTKKEYEKRNIKIWNATAGGMLEVYSRRSLDKFL